MPDTSPTPSKYDRLIAGARDGTPAVTIVAHPCDETSLRGAIDAAAEQLIEPVLVGPEGKIRSVAAEHGIDLTGRKIVDAAHSQDAAARAVALIREGKGELLMKGSLHTDELMRAVTASATGLRTERRISHVFIMDVPGHPETLFITDAAINIFPDLDVKRDIVQNAGAPPWTTPRAVIRHSLRRLLRSDLSEPSIHWRPARAVFAAKRKAGRPDAGEAVFSETGFIVARGRTPSPAGIRRC